MVPSLARILCLVACATCLSGCNIVDEVNQHLQAATGDLQRKRALTVSMETVKDMTRIDIALALTADAIRLAMPSLLLSLNQAEAAVDNDIHFRDVAIVLGDQRLGVDATFSKTIVGATATVRLQASAFVGATSNALHWNLYLDGIELLDIENAPRGVNDPVSVVADALRALIPLLNVILDEAVNDDPRKSVLSALDKKDLLEIDLEDESSDEFTFDKKALRTGMKTEATAVLIDERGIFVATQVAFVRPEEVTEVVPTFPPDEELIRMSSDDWQERLREYQAAVAAILESSAPAELDALVDRQAPGFAVMKQALARALNFTFAQGPISGTAHMRKGDKSSADVALEIKERSCKGYFDACEYQDACAPSRCEHIVNENFIDNACVGTCCAGVGGGIGIGPVGCAIDRIRDGCRRQCQRVRQVVQQVTGDPFCDAFRAVDRLHGGALCAIASNVDKAVCDVDENVKKSLCDLEQELGRYFREHPFGTLTTEVTPAVDLRLSASSSSVSEDLSGFESDFAATGGGQIQTSLKWTRKDYLGEVLVPGGAVLAPCKTDWKETVRTDATLDPFSAHLRFSGTWSTNDVGELVLTYTKQGVDVLYADLSPPPLTELLAGKPQVTINCPLVAFAAAAFGMGEAILTDKDLREILPLLTGQDFPHRLEAETFDLEIEPVMHCEDMEAEMCRWAKERCEESDDAVCSRARRTCDDGEDFCDEMEQVCKALEAREGCGNDGVCRELREKACRQPILRLDPKETPSSIFFQPATRAS